MLNCSKVIYIFINGVWKACQSKSFDGMIITITIIIFEMYAYNLLT